MNTKNDDYDDYDDDDVKILTQQLHLQNVLPLSLSLSRFWRKNGPIVYCEWSVSLSPFFSSNGSKSGERKRAMNAKIAPSSSSNNEEKKETSDTTSKKETKEEKQEDYVTRKCGWMCCGLCTDEYKKKRPVGTQFSEKKERKVTDMCCLLIFIVTMVLWIAIGIFATQAGEPKRLIYGRDLTGDLCSQAPNENKNFLYYPRLNEDLLESLSELGTDWEGLQNAILTGGLDLLTKIKLTGVCVERCPFEGEVVCTRDYLESKGVTRPEELNEYNDISRCRTETMFPYTNERLCSSCWVTPLNTTEIFYRCLEIVLESRYQTERCVNPAYDPDDPDVEMSPDDPRCMTKETTKTEVERKSAYPNPVAEYLGEAVQSLGSYVVCLTSRT